MKIRKLLKKRVTIHIILGIFVILVMIARLLRRDFYPVFLCVLTLLLFNIPLIVDRTLNIKMPTVLEGIVVAFIFCAEILGELGSFYTRIPWWDTLLHTVNGFLMAAIGFAMIDLLNNSPRFHFHLSPIFVAFVAFCFSMTVGVFWEFFEFGMDMVMHTDMQKDYYIEEFSSVKFHPEGLNDPVRIESITDTTIRYQENGAEKEYVIQDGYLDVGIIDTMKDLIVNCIGAIVFSIIGYCYIIGRNKGTFARKFIPQLKTQEEINQEKNEE